MTLDSIYELAIKYPNLTKDVLIKHGCTENDIKGLINKKLFVEYDGNYYASNMNLLLKYYNKVAKTRDYKKQALVLDYILSIEPNYYKMLQQRFFVAIKLDDNQTALYCYKKMYKKDKESCRFDALYNLFLLSKLIYIGPELDKELFGITSKDVSIGKNDTRYKDIDKKNKARALVLNNKFEEAYNAVYKETNANNNFTFQELIGVTLLNRVVSKFKNGHNYAECIQQGRYEDALLSLNNKEQLSYYDKLIIKLLNFIIESPSEVYIDYNHNPGLWESIEANDFKEALRLSVDYNKDKGIDDSTSPMSILLRDILEMLDIYVNYDDTVDDDLYGVYYISNLLDKGYSFEEALDISNLDLRSKLYVTLVFAKEAYIKGANNTGDMLMNIYHRLNTVDDTYEDLYSTILNNKEGLEKEEPVLKRTLTLPNNPNNK